MPLQAAPGSSGGVLPVLELPAEFAAMGGIGLGVMLAAPPSSN